MIEATCHCGAVQLELSHRPKSLTQCTCSICRRYAALWAYCTRSTARVTSDPGAAIAYLWGDQIIEFYHCRVCGCVTHYESTDKTPESRLAVNARMLSPEDIAAATVRTFDGAESWKYLD